MVHDDRSASMSDAITATSTTIAIPASSLSSLTSLSSLSTATQYPNSNFNSNLNSVEKSSNDGSSTTSGSFPHRPELSWFVWLCFGMYLVGDALVPKILQPLLPILLVVWLLWCITMRFQRWSDELPWLGRFTWCFLGLIVELLVENEAVWIVSATDQRRHQKEPALQDNLALAVRWLVQWAWQPFTLSMGTPSTTDEGSALSHEATPTPTTPSQATTTSPLEQLLLYPLGETAWFMFVVLALAFSVLWDQVPYSGFGMMARYCWTICLSRIFRMVSFLLTVLPSPRPGCYQERFPEEPLQPQPWLEWLAIGFRELRGTGGCNDLLFSGHCSFWLQTCLMYRAFYRVRGVRDRPQQQQQQQQQHRMRPSRWCFSVVRWLPAKLLPYLLWTMLVHTAVRDVLEKQHYSVDMFLAVVVTWLVWTQTAWIYDEHRDRILGDYRHRHRDKKQKLPPMAMAMITVSLVTCAVLLFVAGA